MDLVQFGELQKDVHLVAKFKSSSKWCNRITDWIKGCGKKLALASSSKNSVRVLEKVNLLQLFDCVVDGTMISRSKPDQEIVEKACQWSLKS